MRGTNGGGAGAVLETVVSYLRVRHGAELSVARLVDRVRDVEPTSGGSSVAPLHGEALEGALGNLRSAGDRRLAAIGTAVALAGTALDWQVDDGQYYASGALVGDGYRHGNMHTVLARGDDVAMGLFLLVPGVDYLDHRHAAPEFYLNLTGPSSWRFDFGAWAEMAAGSTVWNDPGRVHATRSGSASWLSFWAWLRDIDEPCEVVTR